MKLQAPFPWFGGKSRAAPLIWERLGEVKNYVEPFAGSLAVLLGAPRIHVTETVNDKDGFISNFWRAVAHAPDEVAAHADWPVNENDLHARHAWLTPRREELTARLEGDPDFFDAKIAGWWAWGVSSWIAGGWCSGKGPWSVEDGKLVRAKNGQGVNRQRPHLSYGQGVNRKLPHLGDCGRGVNRNSVALAEWFGALSDRLRRVRVCCGDWSRVLGPSPTTKLGLTAVVLDPPYDGYEEYYAGEQVPISTKVREWAIEHGDDPKMRIALCGYDGEHAMPGGWSVVEWKTKGGYGSMGDGRGRENKHRERIWFSPYCVNVGQKQLSLEG